MLSDLGFHGNRIRNDSSRKNSRLKVSPTERNWYPAQTHTPAQMLREHEAQMQWFEAKYEAFKGRTGGPDPLPSVN